MKSIEMKGNPLKSRSSSLEKGCLRKCNPKVRDRAPSRALGI
jgi:hypothetical protein